MERGRGKMANQVQTQLPLLLPSLRACACELGHPSDDDREGRGGRKRGRPHARSPRRPLVPRPRKETNFNGFQAIWTEEGGREGGAGDGRLLHNRAAGASEANGWKMALGRSWAASFSLWKEIETKSRPSNEGHA